MRKVAVLMLRQSGVTYHRLQVPFEDLLRKGYPINFIINDEQMRTLQADETSHVVLSRGMGLDDPNGFKRHLEKNRIRLVVDQDDWWHLDEHNPAYKAYEFGGSRKMITDTIKISDEVWVIHKKLEKEVRKVNKRANIVIVPNAIDFTTHNWNYTPKEHDGVVFGYVGGNSHREDLMSMGIDFEGKDMVCVKVADFPKITKANKVVDVQPLESYGRIYDEFNVTIAPLKNTRFNQHKSFLKALEAGASKTCFIGTKMHPYTSIIEDGVNGILCSTPEDWRKAVDTLTLEKAKELAERLHKDVKENYSIDVINKIRIEALGF